MKKKVITVILSAMLVGSLLTGCGNSSDSETPAEDVGSEAPATGDEAVVPTETKGEEPVEESGGDLTGEITVYAWTDMYTASSQVAEAFMKEHPEAKINVEQVDAAYTKLIPQLASGQDVADVFMLQNYDLMSFVNTYPGQILDVSDLIQGEESNFAEAAVQSIYNVEDGKYYGVPIDVGPCVFFYRADMLEEYGINVEDIKTWDDYIEAGKVVREKSGGKVYMTGFDFNGQSSQDYVKLLFQQQGGSYYDADGKINLNTPEMVKTYETLQKMIDADIVQNFTSEWDDRIAALQNETICTLPYACWIHSIISGQCEEQKGLWSIAPMPTFDGYNGDVFLGGSVFAIAATTEYPELAKAFVKYELMNPDSAQYMLPNGQFEAYSPYYDTSVYQEAADYWGINIAQEFAKHIEAPGINFGKFFTDAQSGIKQASADILIEGKDMAEALDDASAAAQRSADNK